MGDLHGLSKKQFEVFQVYASKMILRVLNDRDIKLLDEFEKELRLSLLRFFEDTPVRGILIGPAGTGKSRTLTAFFHWMCLWGLSDRIIVSATTGVAAILLSKFLPANTWFKKLRISVNTKFDKFKNPSLLEKFKKI